jgi:hypothetical protein
MLTGLIIAIVTELRNYCNSVNKRTCTEFQWIVMNFYFRGLQVLAAIGLC